MRSTPRGAWWLLLLVVVLLMGLAPFWSVLFQFPWGPDATKWMDNGSLDNPRWWVWATQTKHFIGYRPVTALTMVLNQAITGYEAWGYRTVDLGLHLVSGALLFLLYRLWTGDRGGWGLLAVMALYAHPVTEEVIPYLARRSYLLSLCFGLGALCSHTLASRHATSTWLSPWSLLTGLLMGLAVLSNEVAYVLLPLLPLLAYHHSWRRWLHPIAPLVQVLPTLLITSLAMWQRFRVLGQLSGGYQKHFFAYVKGGHVVWREMAEPDHYAIVDAAWRYLLFPISVSGRAPLTGTGWGLTLASIVVAASLLWFGVVRPLRHRAEEAGRLPLILTLWMVGSTAIIGLSGTWFWRQAYTLLPPLALLIALSLQTLWQERAQRTRLLAGLPLVFLLVGMVYNGPTLGGMDRGPHRQRVAHGQMVKDVRDATAHLQGPATIYLVLPTKGAPGHMIRLSVSRFARNRDLTFRLLANLDPRADPADAVLEFKEVEGRTRLFTDPKVMDWTRPREGRVQLQPHGKLYLDKLYNPRVDRYVLTLDPMRGPDLRKVMPKPSTAPEAPAEPPTSEP